MSTKEMTASPSEALLESCEDIRRRLYDIGVYDPSWSSLPRSEQFGLVASLTGSTALETVSELSSLPIFSKLEYQNLSGSHYDRAYLATIAMLETSKLIYPGDELRDITSGSAGISLAVIANALGYKARLVVPSELPPNRVFPMEYFGANIVESGPGYVPVSSNFQKDEITALRNDPAWTCFRSEDREMRALVFKNAAGERRCYLNHSENLITIQAFREIGQELIQQCQSAPSAVVLAMGNWTTIAGISPTVKHSWPGTSLIGYEGQDVVCHNNFGTSVENVPLRYRDDHLVDAMARVSDIERDEMDKRINSHRSPETQIGRSSIMGLVVAEKLAKTLGGPIVTIAYDQRLRY